MKTLRQWLGWRARPESGDFAVFQQWGDAHQFRFRRVHEGDGCVLEGRLALRPCRVEWGPAQRSYMGLSELRLVADLDVPAEMVLVLVNRQLMAEMEQAVYEQFVDDVQTRMDTDAPAEMRWLVLFAHAGGHELGRLRERYGGASNLMPWLVQWLAGPLNDALAVTLDTVPPEQPIAITIKSGRLMLRTAMAQPDGQALVQWASVFEHALREAGRMHETWPSQGLGNGPHTEPRAWPLSKLESAAPALGDAASGQPSTAEPQA